MLTWIGQVDQSGGDMCHHCKGDMWHARTDDVVGLTHGRFVMQEHLPHQASQHGSGGQLDECQHKF
jgi:hypothetical protein